MIAKWLCHYECGHFDCQDERGRRSKCPVCDIPVPENEGFTLTRGKRTYTTHFACAEAFLAKNPAESEPEELAQNPLT